MAEWKPVGSSRNLPSTYQQVIQNMLYLEENVVPLVGYVNQTVKPAVETVDKLSRMPSIKTDDVQPDDQKPGDFWLGPISNHDSP